MRKSKVAEYYVQAVQDMYEDCLKAARCTARRGRVLVGSGVPQLSVLSPFTFAIVMDRLTDEIREEPPRTMMFTDDVAICCKSREEAETELGR